MIGPYHYTPAIWPSVLTVLLLTALSVYAWRRRSVPGALPFAIAGMLFALWVAGYTLLIAAMDPAAKIFWLKFGGVWQMFGVTAVTCFLLEYAWPGRWLTRRNLALLSIPPLLIMGLILTGDLHHLFWRGFVVDGQEVTILFGPAGQAAVAYGVGLVLVNLVVFGWLFLRSPQHRWPVVLMATGQIAARVAYVAHVGEAIQSELLLNVVGVAFLFVMYAFALFGFRMFDPVALARQTLMEQLSDGMLVLDQQGRVVSMNPAAERIFGLTARQVKHKPVREVLPAYPQEPQPVTSGTEIEFSLPASGGVSHYRLVISLLNNWRGQEVGRLLLLRDVTGQKRDQAQLVEQQRALAMLHEREQLARELHDSLGQVLGYTGLRMEAARKLIADGKLATADEQLVQLENIVADAHADVREYILNLRTAPTGQQSFFSALQHYLDGFLKNYGIRADLSIGAGVDEGIFAPDTQMQLFHIIQEAFSNARRHAQTDCVQLSFEREERLVRVRIQDHGQGFDPQQVATQGGSHFGLRFMRERAEALGGCLQVISQPGQGTQVVVQVPVHGEQ